jgi:hypothetical protein
MKSDADDRRLEPRADGAPVYTPEQRERIFRLLASYQAKQEKASC